MRKIVFLISVFVLSLSVNFRNVNAARADIIQGTYTCYKGGIVLSTGNVSVGPGDLYSNGLNLAYKCPSGWTNVNFSLQFNLSGVGVMPQGWDITLKWISTSGSYNSRILSIDNNTDGLANPNPGGINLVSGVVGSGNRYNFAIFGNGGANNQLLQGLRIGTDEDKLLLSQYLAGQKNFDEVTSALQSSMNSIINNQNQNKNDIINNQNQNQAQTNQKLDELQKEQEETNDFLTDDTPPDSDISGLGNVSGLLPPGPLDSLLNIPFQFLSILTSSMSGTCVPLTGDFVWGSKITLPCFDEIIYGNVNSTLMNFISLIPASFILIKYFKHLYKKVERAVSLESTSDDEWGCI